MIFILFSDQHGGLAAAKSSSPEGEAASTENVVDSFTPFTVASHRYLKLASGVLKLVFFSNIRIASRGTNWSKVLILVSLLFLLFVFYSVFMHSRIFAFERA